MSGGIKPRCHLFFLLGLGTWNLHPPDRVHSGAVAAAARAGLDLATATPRSLDAVGRLPPLVVTVCDQAHEELAPADSWLHWSIPDPVIKANRVAFDATVRGLRERIQAVVADGKGAA